MSNPDTFENWPRDFALGNGMIVQGGGIGSTSILHDLREVLRYVFAELHGCDPDDLRCNPDGVACYLPAGLVKAKRLRDTSGKPIPKRMAGEAGKTWAHVDGGFGGQVLPGRMGVTVQGQVPLVAQAEEGATLVVVEGSHLKGAEFRRKHNLQGPKILSPEQLEALVAMGGLHGAQGVCPRRGLGAVALGPVPLGNPAHARLSGARGHWRGWFDVAGRGSLHGVRVHVACASGHRRRNVQEAAGHDALGRVRGPGSDPVS